MHRSDRIVRFAWALIILITTTLLGPALAGSDSYILTPVEAQSRAERGELTIIDIRRPDEWQNTGIPTGAERATIRFTGRAQRFLAQIDALTRGDKSMPIALICAAGVRSKHASALLRQRGYTNVHDISEGMLGNGRGGGWLQRNLPTMPCTDC